MLSVSSFLGRRAQCSLQGSDRAAQHIVIDTLSESYCMVLGPARPYAPALEGLAVIWASGKYLSQTQSGYATPSCIFNKFQYLTSFLSSKFVSKNFCFFN